MNTSYQLGLNLVDAFGSVVQGPYLATHRYTAALTVTNCGAYTASKPVSLAGETAFEFELQGLSGLECLLLLQVIPTNSSQVLPKFDPMTCKVRITPCDDGYEEKEDDDGFGYCKEGMLCSTAGGRAGLRCSSDCRAS